MPGLSDLPLMKIQKFASPFFWKMGEKGEKQLLP